MKIKLNEIPNDGRDYTFNEKTAELTPAIKDLVAQNNYDLKFHIKPFNHKDFEVRGQLTTSTSEICSLCGETFNFKIKTQINEILIPVAATDKAEEKQSRSNHVSELDDEGPSVTEYQNDIFDLGELTHQTIALAIPFSPKPDSNDDGSCKVCLKINLKDNFKYDEDLSNFNKAKENENPFSVLKTIKPH